MVSAKVTRESTASLDLIEFKNYALTKQKKLQWPNQVLTRVISRNLELVELRIDIPLNHVGRRKEKVN